MVWTDLGDGYWYDQEMGVIVREHKAGWTIIRKAESEHQARERAIHDRLSRLWHGAGTGTRRNGARP